MANTGTTTFQYLIIPTFCQNPTAQNVNRPPYIYIYKYFERALAKFMEDVTRQSKKEIRKSASSILKKTLSIKNAALADHPGNFQPQKLIIDLFY